MADRYELLSKLASGGMAEVYLAVLRGEEGFRKLAVVKRMLPELAHREELRQMFIREAQLMASLSHSNVASVLDFGLLDGQHFIALEYVEGVDLAVALEARGRLEPPLAIYLVTCILRGLAYVHSRDIVHRDVSPHNILLGASSDVKLGDFGIARAQAVAHQTSPGTLKGKIAYMSPEQALGRPVDGRSDLFSTGVVLYECLLGARPFQGDTELELLRAVSEAQFPHPLHVDPSLDPRLAAVVVRALKKEPEERYATAQQMADDLLQCVDGPGAGPAEIAALVGPLRKKEEATDPFLEALREKQGFSTVASRSLTSAEQREAVLRPRTGSLVWQVAVGGLVLAGALVLAQRTLWDHADSSAEPKVRPVPVMTPRPLAMPTVPEISPPPAPAPVATAPAKRVAPKSTPEPAQLDINSTPWAQVWIDGVLRGETPLVALEVKPGRHQLRLSNPVSGQQAAFDFQVRAGERRVLPVNLVTGRMEGGP